MKECILFLFDLWMHSILCFSFAFVIMFGPFIGAELLDNLELELFGPLFVKISTAVLIYGKY